MKQAHIFVSGFVQGVGFRQFVKKNARKLGLTGWVQNLPDGRVEAVFQGPDQTLDQIIKLCKKGSYISEVEDVFVQEEDSDKLCSDFTIIK